MEGGAPIDTAAIRRYLLGDVADDDRARLEERMLLEDELYDRVLVEEDETIEAYLEGELEPADVRRFETVFLAAPERKQQLRFARTLRRHFDEQARAAATRGVAPRAATRRRWLLAAAALVVAALGFAVVVWRSQALERELSAAHGEREAGEAREREAAGRLSDAERENARLSDSLRAEQEERERLADEVARLERQAAAPAAVSDVATLGLDPGRVRSGGESARVVVGRGVRTLRLRLAGAPAEAVTVSLRDADGRVAWSGGGRRSTGSLVVLVPAAGLADDDYQVVLERAAPDVGSEVVARYYFRLVKR